jgi:hypothetical protein
VSESRWWRWRVTYGPLWRTQSTQCQHIYLALIVKVGLVYRWCVWSTVGMGRHEFRHCLRRGLYRWSLKVKSDLLARGDVMTMTLVRNLDDGLPIQWRVCASYGWPGWPVVPNVVVFYADIGTFVSVFGQFSLIKWPTLLCLIIENGKSFALFQNIYRFIRRLQLHNTLAPSTIEITLILSFECNKASKLYCSWYIKISSPRMIF